MLRLHPVRRRTTGKPPTLVERLAAHAPQLFASIGLFSRVLFVILVLRMLVLAVLAPQRLLYCFAAAPPQLAGELTSVDATAPVEVLLLLVVILTELARPLA